MYHAEYKPPATKCTSAIRRNLVPEHTPCQYLDHHTTALPDVQRASDCGSLTSASSNRWRSGSDWILPVSLAQTYPMSRAPALVISSSSELMADIPQSWLEGDIPPESNSRDILLYQRLSLSTKVTNFPCFLQLLQFTRMLAVSLIGCGLVYERPDVVVSIAVSEGRRLYGSGTWSLS
jgi:hypothetical protein